MTKLINKLANLVDVKSLVTISFTVTFVILSLTSAIPAADFMTTFLIIITYYFSKKEDNMNKSE